MVRPTRFERATYRVGVCHSIQLSYGRISLGYYSKPFSDCKARKAEFFHFYFSVVVL